MATLFPENIVETNLVSSIQHGSKKTVSVNVCSPFYCLRHVQWRSFGWLPISLNSEFLLYHIMFVCRLGTPLAAEELNTVVGTAFRVAYAAQLQSQKVQFLNS